LSSTLVPNLSPSHHEYIWAPNWHQSTYCRRLWLSSLSQHKCASDCVPSSIFKLVSSNNWRRMYSIHYWLVLDHNLI
jgi:hypothetical protein